MSGYSALFQEGEIVKSASSGNNKTDDRGLWIARSHVPLRFQCLHFCLCLLYLQTYSVQSDRKRLRYDCITINFNGILL